MVIRKLNIKVTSYVCHDVWNFQQINLSLNSLLRLKKPSKFRITGELWGESNGRLSIAVTHAPSNVESVTVSWRHHRTSNLKYGIHFLQRLWWNSNLVCLCHTWSYKSEHINYILLMIYLPMSFCSAIKHISMNDSFYMTLISEYIQIKLWEAFTDICPKFNGDCRYSIAE